jgi:hypothetical protein
MTLVTLPSPIIYPGMLASGSTLFSVGGDTTLDAAGEYVAHIFQARSAMTISHVGFRPSTVTGSGTVDIRIETVGTDGFPSGSLWAANTNIAGTALSSNTWSLQALTASASIASGEWVAVKFVYNSGTSVQTGRFNNAAPRIYGRAYRAINTGTPTQSAYTSAELLAVVGSSSTAFYNLSGMTPATAETDTDFASGSTPNRYGIRFQIPFKARCRGISFNSAQVGDFTAAIYSDAGALLGSIDVDGNNFITGNDGACFIIDDDVTLNANTWYRATIEATTVTNQEVQTITLPSADYLSGTRWSANAHLTTWNGSAWDDTNTAILPCMNLLLDQIDDGTGSGSGGARSYGIQPISYGV